jgi:hypothetical protein
MEVLTNDMINHMVNIMDGLYILSELDGRLVRAVDDAKRKKGIDDLQEYFIEQEANVPLLKKIYKIS